MPFVPVHDVSLNRLTRALRESNATFNLTFALERVEQSETSTTTPCATNYS